MALIGAAVALSFTQLITDVLVVAGVDEAEAVAAVRAGSGALTVDAAACRWSVWLAERDAAAIGSVNPASMTVRVVLEGRRRLPDIPPTERGRRARP